MVQISSASVTENDFLHADNLDLIDRYVVFCFTA